jgi:hypothetical protein
LLFAQTGTDHDHDHPILHILLQLRCCHAQLFSVEMGSHKLFSQAGPKL